MHKTLHFKTNTLLKNLVGKDLINDDNIAIVELVKNSYDADSKSVLIEFQGFSGNGKTDHVSSKIIIADQGRGMSEEDIREKWLNIAYSEKKTSSQKPGAFLAGNKGVGRFSCDRLGKKLDIFTRKRGENLLHLEINWEDFEVEDEKDLTIQKIKIFLSEITPTKAVEIVGFSLPATGTLLLISKLRNIWNEARLLDLKSHLEKFINPNQLFQKKEFEINLKADHYSQSDQEKDYHEQVNGIIQNLIFENLKFRATFIESTIVADGKSIETKLFHEGEPVFRVKEKNIEYPQLKNINVVIYYLNPYKKSYFKRQTGIRAIDFGSIFLFLNGFRVAPYGERGNDWLGLDVRKGQGTARFLGSRDIVGRIEVVDVDHETLFQPVSSREGLKNTDAFVVLKDRHFRSVLRRLERFVVDGLSWDSVPISLRNEFQDSDGLDWENTSEKYEESWDKKRQRISKSILPMMGLSKDRVIAFWFNPSLLEGLAEQKADEINKILQDIEGFKSDVVDGDLKKKLKRFGQIVSDKNLEIKSAKRKVINLEVEVEEKKKAIKELEKKSKQYQAQTLFLKSASTLDEKKLLGFHHQICLDSSIVDNYIEKTVKALRDEKDVRAALKHVEKISKANKKIMATAQYATKANFSSGSRKEMTDLPAYFEQYLNNVTKEFSGSGLKLVISNLVFEAFEIKVKRIELSILIDNIVSNSDKAHAKSLYVTMEMDGKNKLVISFLDNGKGLDESIDVESVFDMGVTSTRGSGLGLYHVKQILDSLDAGIEFIPKESKGVEIRMVFIK